MKSGLSAREIFIQLQLIAKGHFKIAPNRHASRAIFKDQLYTYPHWNDVVGNRFVRQLTSEEKQSLQIVVAIEKGGLLFGPPVALYLDMGSRAKNPEEARIVFAEKKGDDFIFAKKRGYEELVAGKNVLLIQDAFRTGASARKVIALLTSLDAKVLVAGGICDYAGLTAESLGVGRFSVLEDLSRTTWDEPECPLCKAGDMAIVDLTEE